MELSNFLTKILIFLKMKNGTSQPHIFLIFQEGTLRAQKVKKKNHSENFFYISGMKLSNRKIKNFQEGTLKSQT